MASRKKFFKGEKKRPKLVRSGSAILAKTGKRFIPIGRLPPRSLAALAFIKKTRKLKPKKRRRN